MSRCGGRICIECLDQKHMEQISKLLSYLCLPLLSLEIGREIVLDAPGSMRQVYSMIHVLPDRRPLTES